MISNAEYGAKSTMTAILGRMATYSGKRIPWDKAIAANDRMVPDSAKLDWDKTPPVKPDSEGKYPVPVPGKTRVL